MERIINNWLKPKNDFVFKLIFGSDHPESKELLAALLGDLLNIKKVPHFDKIENLNPFSIQQDINDKNISLDIKAKVLGYGVVNLEIQLVNQKNIHKRALYYLCKLIEEQLGKGDNYSLLSKVVGIYILDFPFFNTDPFHTKYLLMDEITHTHFPDLMEIHFLELSKFKKLEKEDKIDVNNPMTKWLQFLSNEDDSRWEVMAKKDPFIEKAVDILRVASLDPNARMQYEAREKALKDMASIYADGLEDGLEKGRIEGYKDGMKEVARKLLRSGMGVKIISEITELSIEEIKQL